MTPQTLPSGGGSYEIDAKGNLTPLQVPETTYDTAIEREATVIMPDVEPNALPEPATKAGHRATAVAKEA